MALVLENEKLRVKFDQGTGAVTGLLNKTTNWQVIQQPKLAMGIRLLVLIPDCKNNQVKSEYQHLALAQMDESGTSITLRWDRIIGDKSGSLDISITQRIKLKDSDLEFKTQIDNHSPYTIEEAWSPYLGGIHKPGQSKFEGLLL